MGHLSISGAFKFIGLSGIHIHYYMLSVPSFELLPSSNEKELDSPSAHTATSFNDQLEELSLLERPAKEDRMALCRSAEERILEWFANRDISMGSPEELISAHKDQQRRMVSQRVRGDFRMEEVLIKRNLGRKLTIDI
jgi:hypothetical protein